MLIECRKIVYRELALIASLFPVRALDFQVQHNSPQIVVRANKSKRQRSIIHRTFRVGHAYDLADASEVIRGRARMEMELV